MILSVGLLSYGLAAIGFLILTLLLAISWEGRAQGVRLIVACAVTALWASLFAVGSQFVVLSGSLVLLAEFLRGERLFLGGGQWQRGLDFGDVALAIVDDYRERCAEVAVYFKRDGAREADLLALEGRAQLAVERGIVGLPE